MKYDVELIYHGGIMAVKPFEKYLKDKEEKDIVNQVVNSIEEIKESFQTI